MPAATAEMPASTTVAPAGFSVHLEVFEGPFDLLLSLIARHRLDVTMVALSQVTDEFIGYIRAQGDGWDLDVASDFLVVAATLLDLKAARLLPAGDVDDEEDLALLEARDLLFARLLAYRAFQEVAALLAERMAEAGRAYPRAVALEEPFAALLPDVVLGVPPAELAVLAARAMTPREPPTVSIEHLHRPRVSVAEQASLLARRLRAAGRASFTALVADAAGTVEVVGRFLALLELYRIGAVAFEQAAAFDELTVCWTGADEEVRVDTDW